jgi:hypothetical protein
MDVREVIMEGQESKVPAPVPVQETGAEFQKLRQRFNQLFDEITKSGTQAASLAALGAVRCGGGCHQGVIEAD